MKLFIIEGWSTNSTMNTPLGDAFGSEDLREFERNHHYTFKSMSDAAMIAMRERPYNGQIHTDHGKRGQQEVVHLTMRDIADCMARGIRQACMTDDDFETGNFSYVAAIQNACGNIEKMMGIFPNIPSKDDT